MSSAGAWQRVCALYLPLMSALLLSLTTARRPRRFAACLLGLLWTGPALLLVERTNRLAGWWIYPQADWQLCGIPLELFTGWTILWGILPSLAFPRLRLAWVLTAMAAFDLLAMPLCSSAVQLGPQWLAGEAVAIGIALTPAVCLARWTERDSHLALRVGLQVAAAGLLFLFFVPEVVFAIRPGSGWDALLRMSSWQRQLVMLLIFITALPGIGAAMEFAQRGFGTPIPYDPPRRLVVSGIYRYCANPMQLSCSATILAWAAVLHNVWLLVPAGFALLYSAGIARWDEEQDLAARFGDEWRAYRREVRNWLPRVLPYCPERTEDRPARLYLAAGCRPCSSLWQWIERQSPLGLEIAPAEMLHDPVQRMTYDPNDGTPAVSGIRAMGRVLEHFNLAWAMAGTALRLPGVWRLVQLLMDASGLGPRELGRDATRDLVPPSKIK